jgi:hypothetical protein
MIMKCPTTAEDYIECGVAQSLLSVMTSDMPCDRVTWPIS